MSCDRVFASVESFFLLLCRRIHEATNRCGYYFVTSHDNYPEPK